MQLQTQMGRTEGGYHDGGERFSARDLLNGVNGSSEAASTGWLIYVAIAAYFIVALGGVTHKDLLLNSPITLPLLGIDVTLDRFFLFAPPFFIALHFGVMMQHVVLSRKIYAFLDAVKREEAEAGSGAPAHPLRFELDGNFFTQFLAGPPNCPIFVFFMQTMVWGTLVMLAAIVLVYFQIAFLPFHNEALTWAHRFYVLADLAVVAGVGVFLPSPLTGMLPSFIYGWRHYTSFMTITTLAFAGFAAFTFCIATLPGEWLDRTMAAIGPSRVISASQPGADRVVFAPTAYLFEGGVNPATGRSESLMQRNLVVMDEDLVTDRGLPADEASLRLRYRDLRYARLDRSDLRQADLTCADLTGASLEGANLDGARLGCPGARR